MPKKMGPIYIYVLYCLNKWHGVTLQLFLMLISQLYLHNIAQYTHALPVVSQIISVQIKSNLLCDDL